MNARNARLGQTIDEICGQPPGTFRKSIAKERSEMRAERERKLAANRTPPPDGGTKMIAIGVIVFLTAAVSVLGLFVLMVVRGCSS